MVCIVLVSSVNRFAKPALDVTRGSYLKNHAFHVTTTANVEKCASECLLHKLCQSLNYNVTSQICTLNAASRSCAREQGLEESSTSVYLEVKDIPPDYSGSCYKHDCIYGERCKSNRMMPGYTCVRQGLRMDFLNHYHREPMHASCYITSRGRILRLSCSTFGPDEQSSDHCPSIRLESQSSSLCDASIGISCSSTDCYMAGSPYVGHRTCTISGYTCQRWDAFSPHSHSYNTSDR